MGKFSDYKLPLKSLPQGQQVYRWHLGKQFFANMENADIHGADIDVTLTVDHKTGKEEAYHLDFHCTGELTLLCDRCLDAMQLPVDTTYRITVKYGDRYNDDSDTVLEIPQSENFLNVAYMLHDTIALTIPIKHVHPAGKCNRAMSAALHKHGAKGSAGELEQSLIDEMDSMESDNPEDSGDAPTDPRWDALKGLASDSPDE